jgi:D-arabinose 1-dehydrogenase-like Zn-dependent alcohol dehydrogenase
MAFQYDGAWADYVVVPTEALVHLPDELPLERCAVIADAVATPYAALVSTAALRPAESVAIWGLGGLGTHAVQIARLCGAAPIIALDPRPAARERALRLGADHAVDPMAQDAHAQVRRLSGGGVDVALDGVGRSVTTRQANRCLAAGGRIVLMGMSAEHIDAGIEAGFAVTRHRMFGHLGYRKEHLEQLVRLVASGRLDLGESVSAQIPLSDISEGVRMLQSGAAPVRIVVRP